MSLNVVNLEGCLERISDLFSPHIVAEVNGQHVKLARLEGDKVPWHTHGNEDELFLVLDGELRVETADTRVVLRAGDLTVVPRGVEHRVVPCGHVRLLLVEPPGIAHTGSVRCEITRDHYARLVD